MVITYVMLTVELHNVRYANNSPVYHLISPFDHALEMVSSTSDSGIVFYSKIIQRQTAIKDLETLSLLIYRWNTLLANEFIKSFQRCKSCSVVIKVCSCCYFC